MRNYINPRAFNREIKGYKDKYVKQSVADNNCTNEIKLRWLYARLKRVVKGKHWCANDDESDKILGIESYTHLPIFPIPPTRKERRVIEKSIEKIFRNNLITHYDNRRTFNT